MMNLICLFAVTLLGEVSPESTEIEIQEVVFEEDISDVPDEDEDLEDEEELE